MVKDIQNSCNSSFLNGNNNEEPVTVNLSLYRVMATLSTKFQ